MVDSRLILFWLHEWRGHSTRKADFAYSSGPGMSGSAIQATQSGLTLNAGGGNLG